jgi:hypothetical protein
MCVLCVIFKDKLYLHLHSIYISKLRRTTLEFETRQEIYSNCKKLV